MAKYQIELDDDEITLLREMIIQFNPGDDDEAERCDAVMEKLQGLGV